MRKIVLVLIVFLLFALILPDIAAVADENSVVIDINNPVGHLYDEKCTGPYVLKEPTNFVPVVTHSGDLIIDGTKVMTIENEKYLQQGNIYVNDQAKLVLKNSQLAIARGDVATIHTYFFISKNASMEIENSLVFPARKGGRLVCVFNHGKVSIVDSPTTIHYFDMSEGAHLTMKNSAMVGPIGGLLQISGGDMKLVNSTIGAVGLRIPANAHLDVTGLKSGVYFESWDVHSMIPEANYNLVLEKTCILKDNFTGELKYGPYERGWLFFPDPDAHVNISSSEVRKVFIDVLNDNVEFENLKIGIPSSLKYRDIRLKDITMMGQWPFTIINSNVTIRNSDYLFIQPSGQSTVSLINSHVVEFIPRDFFGTMIFEKGLWTVAGEIIGGVPHHSMENDFTIKGSLRIAPEVRENLQWKNAKVVREYNVIVEDKKNSRLEGILIEIDQKRITSDNKGKAKFSLIFSEFNYSKPIKLKAFDGEYVIAQKEIDFFTETPIVITKD